MGHLFKFIKALAAGLSLTALVACGSGGGSDTPETPPPAAGPAITSSPAATSVTAGQPANFSVTASGTGLTYQWTRDGANIAGATAATYSVPATVIGDNNAQIRVVVTNASGSTTSNPATLSVVPLVITTQPANVTIGDNSVTQLSVVAAGPGTLSYQWQRGGVDIAGATASTYSIGSYTASAQPDPKLPAAPSATAFRVVVRNALGAVTSADATVTVVAAAPTIITQPFSTSVRAGVTGLFTVVVAGTPAFTFEWLRNGVVVQPVQTGATNLVQNYEVRVPSVAADNGASFQLRITNSLGSVTSNAAVLTVTP